MGCLVGAETTVPLLQPPQREWDTRKKKKKLKNKPNRGFCYEVLN